MKIYAKIAIMMFFIATPLASFSFNADSLSDSIRKIAPVGISESFYSCLDKAGNSSIDEAACITNEKSNQDARLNKAYKKLMTVLKGDLRNKLIESEKTWIASRAKDNYFELNLYSNGSQVGNLQLVQNDTFRLCERANAIEKYLTVASLSL